MNRQQEWYKKGLRDGIPICLGYLAVSFSFGIKALGSGLTVLEAVMMSLLNLTSAGQFGALTILQENGGFLALALSQFIINLRYSLMSASLSQKIDRNFPFLHRFIMAFGNSDEVFALSVSVEGPLSPFYTYGLMSVAIPGWTLGTLLGAIAGSVLPDQILSALGVALYGMFCAIIIPPAKKDHTLMLIIVISMLASALFTYAPLLNQIPSGTRVILLTVIISAFAAYIRPVKEEQR